MSKIESKKKKVLGEIFTQCLKQGDLTFDNELLHQISRSHQFGNPHDVVKIDTSDLLPDVMREHDYYIIHLGSGRHRFMKGVKNGFHKFEDIPDSEVLPWKYRQSILNEIDTSESNILSVGINHRILHDFLYDDVAASPKIYNSHRTKKSLAYNINGERIETNNLQMELDMKCEYQQNVTVFEAKNKFPKDFAIYQLFHPYLYLSAIRDEKNLPIKSITNCYLLRNIEDGESVVRVYLYQFDGIEMTSIKLVKCAGYRFIKRTENV